VKQTSRTENATKQVFKETKFVNDGDPFCPRQQ